MTRRYKVLPQPEGKPRPRFCHDDQQFYLHDELELDEELAAPYVESGLLGLTKSVKPKKDDNT